MVINFVGIDEDGVKSRTQNVIYIFVVADEGAGFDEVSVAWTINCSCIYCIPAIHGDYAAENSPWMDSRRLQQSQLLHLLRTLNLK